MDVISATLSILASILIDAIIFNVLYSTLNYGASYLVNVLIYTLCMEFKLIITSGIISFFMFLMTFGVYFVLGLILVYILSRISDNFSRIPFIIISIVIQAGVVMLSYLFIGIIY